PQLPGVLPGRYRSDDRPKEPTPTIDRQRWHAKGLQPLAPVLVLSEDTFFHPWLGGGFGTPSRIKSRLTQGALNDRWVGERFLAVVTGLAEGQIEAIDRLVAATLTRPGEQRKGGMTGSVGVAGVVPSLINLRQAQELPGHLDRAHLGDFSDP